MTLSEDFADVQRRLPEALTANRPDSTVDHVVVALPSYSLGESLLSHYVDRIPALEHRYLVSQLVLHRIESCRAVFVASRHPGADVLEYYASFGGRDSRRRAHQQFHVLEVPDPGGRSVAAKLLEREDLLEQLRRFVGDRPALIEPWNVTEAEVEVACRIGVPINGTAPSLRHIGFKSEGRRVFREADVPIPVGVEDVTSIGGVRDAIESIRSSRVGAAAVIVKLDDSGSGDGNVILDLREPDLDSALRSLPEWYVRDLADGGVVEERVAGTRFSSPSAQLDLLPTGEVVVLATHEQVLGGASGQVYMGCRFPADGAYAAGLASHAAAVGDVLASRGVLGRVAIDFAATQDASGAWSIYALEINLRKGGTTHPYTTLRSLVPGRYDAGAARWISQSGGDRAYTSTDNLVDPAWLGRDPTDGIQAIAHAGLQFDPDRGTGVVLHMLSGLAIDGRLGLTAIGHDPGHADELYQAAGRALHEMG